VKKLEVTNHMAITDMHNSVRCQHIKLSGDPCRPQELHLASCSKFFEPVFVVESAENVLYSDPASGWQLMPTGSRAWQWSSIEIRDPWSQARMWSSLIVVGNPDAILSMLQMSKDPK